MMKRRSGSSSPIECRPLTNVPSRSMRASAGAPMRVMMRMLATTYGLIGDLDAAARDRRIDRAHAVRDHVHRAAAHRAVEQRIDLSRAPRPGPSSCCSGRRRPCSSCRRTSGARRARRRSDSSDAASSSDASRRSARSACRRAPSARSSSLFSSSEPSHQCTASGWVSRATSSTHRFNAWSLLDILAEGRFGQRL